MLPVFANKVVVTICLYELFGLILGVEQSFYLLHVIKNHPDWRYLYMKQKVTQELLKVNSNLKERLFIKRKVHTY
jgi:hypothetical protein